MAHHQHKELLTVLNECIAACNHCAFACLSEPDVTPMAACIKSDLDCADICTLVAKLVARGSEHAKHLMNECIEVCEACAAECEKHAHHMDHCKECAEACRKCAEACRAYA